MRQYYKIEHGSCGTSYKHKINTILLDRKYKIQEHVAINVGEDIRQDYLSGYYGGIPGADLLGRGGGSILPSSKSFRAAPTLT